MKANRFAAINDNPIMAHVPYGDTLGSHGTDMRHALNFHPDLCDVPMVLPPVQLASFLHCDLADFLSRQAGA
jgi:hypothetical protein